MRKTDINNLAKNLNKLADELQFQDHISRDVIASFNKSDRYLWDGFKSYFQPVHKNNTIDIDMLVGIDEQIRRVYQNTEQFAKGLSANNVLLWGERGMGKSACVKSVFSKLNEVHYKNLKLIQLSREAMEDLPYIIKLMENTEFRFIIFCDDLSYDQQDQNFKTFKSVLDGGICEVPENIIFYATSNRRHLYKYDVDQQNSQSLLSQKEDAQEIISLSDRFGLWIGFYPCSQDEYLEMISRYVTKFDLPVDKEQTKKEGLEWARSRGARSGRIAWHFIKDIAGRKGYKLRAQNT